MHANLITNRGTTCGGGKCPMGECVSLYPLTILVIFARISLLSILTKKKRRQYNASTFVLKTSYWNYAKTNDSDLPVFAVSQSLHYNIKNGGVTNFIIIIRSGRSSVYFLCILILYNSSSGQLVH